MAVVVEVLDAGGHRHELQRVEGSELLVGRSFACDLVVADPHADPEHCRISLSGQSDTLEVADLNSLNGTRMRSRLLRGESKAVESGTVITVGKTRLRVSNPALAVPPAEPLSRLHFFVEWASKTTVMVSLLAVVGVITGFQTYYRTIGEFNATDVILGWLAQLGVFIAIVGFWSLLGRMSKRKANIKAHTSIASAGWIVGWAWGLALSAMEYNINGGYMEPYLSSLTAGFFTIAFQYLHMTIATRIKLVSRLVIVALLYAIGPVLMLYLDYEFREEFSRGVDYPVTIMPPAWFVAETQSTEGFMDSVASTFTAATAEAAEEVTSDADEDEEDLL